MSSNYPINPPGSSEEFERWCLLLAREKYGPDAFLYTRKKQHGIDIYWLQRGKYFVIQCKQRSEPDQAELIRSLEADFETARNYFGTDMEQFVFAATISLEQASKAVRRDNGNIESLLNAVCRLGSDHNVMTACWHWEGIESDIADSPFLMAHLLGQEKGGELINKIFLADQNKKYGSNIELKKDFYGGKKTVQWCGILQQLDAPRQAYQRAKQAIESGFKRDYAVAALIKGEGGSGKSVLLRRLAHDLCADYVVYWLESDIQSFLDCEWTYDVLKHSKPDEPTKYLIFLEDWYQNVENSGLQQEAAELLSKVGKNPHVRLVIGDRAAKQGMKRNYEAHVSSPSIFELNASENIALLDTIFTKMPEWREIASQEQIEKAANATLFQLLFIFQYAEDLSGDIADIYKRIFVSDCRVLLGYSLPFWKGMAKALYFYANLYVHEGVVVPVEFLRDLAAYFGGCPVPDRYSTSINELVNNKILMKYFGLSTTTKKNIGVVNFFRFHHDTMADRGWMLIGDAVDEQYDVSTLNSVLDYLKDKYPWIVGPIYYRQSNLPGNPGMDAARNYLKMSHPEDNHAAFTGCLKKLRNEVLAKDNARKFLETENPWVIKEAFCVSLNLLKDEDIAKDRAREFLKTANSWEVKEAFCVSLSLLGDESIAKDKAQKFLESDEPWKIHQAFSASLHLLRNEDIVKIKARKFLETVCPWEIREAFCVCINLLKDESSGINMAVLILKNRHEFNADHHWTLILRSLNVLHNKPEHGHLVTLVANEIIANRCSAGHKFLQLLRIPLFQIPQWVKSSEHNISNWPKSNFRNLEKPYINRDTLYSITIGYKDKPELIQAMCLGLIHNWKFELRIKQKHQAYLIRCLAHPAIQRDDKLRQGVISICKEILDYITQPPLIVNEGTRFWLKNIVEHNLFPEWDYEHETDGG